MEKEKKREAAKAAKAAKPTLKKENVETVVDG